MSAAEWCVVCMQRTYLCSCPKSPELRCAPDVDEGCECPGAHECGVTTSTAANERRARSAADERVLAAMSAIPREKLQSWIDRGFDSVLELAKAELARREGRNDETHER